MIDESKNTAEPESENQAGTEVNATPREPERQARRPAIKGKLDSVRAFVAGLAPLLSRSHRKISTQLYLAFAVIVALTLLATLVGWFSFDRVATAQRHVNDESIPEMVAAFEVAWYSSNLITGAPRIVTAQSIPELNEIYDNTIVSSSNALESELSALESASHELGIEQKDATFKKIRQGVNLLTGNIETIRNQRTELIVQAEKREKLRQDLAEVRRQLEVDLVEALDDQLFYINTGYWDMDSSPDPRSTYTSNEELGKYRLLSELQVDANIATELLGNAFTVLEPASLEPLRERFEAAMIRVGLNLEHLKGSEAHGKLAPTFEQLEALGVAEGAGFNLLDEELRLAQRQTELLESNQVAAVILVGEVDDLVGAARGSAQDATEASLQAILTGRTILLVISLASVVVASLVGWLLVGRVLLRRIGMVSAWMRRMAAGDLEAQVDVGGHDEVADMAAAVEVFRLHALEVQRLNLVELLASDLQEKNDELQAAFEELRRAQDQIVTQQKLASLGELTAGVAHEIRNPLNFVKNFSESSAELLTELQEVLDEIGDDLPEEQKGLIQEISDDLNDNMERIRNHGDRANRIVHDMLMMSRGSGDFQITDINRLVDEHSRLAFHSARATDSDFQLDLRFDLDPNVGELEVIPQDLGRVFLNMVSNSCYATNEKRVDLLQKGVAFSPELLLTTRRLDDSIEVGIRDNGNGMPDEVIEKIFNPFFTTKPTDQGTGLGLAISSDIVREHGGFIRVTSEPGEYTQMLIELPLVRSVVSVDGEHSEGESREEAEELEREVAVES